MHELRLGPGHAPVSTEPRCDRRQSALVVPQVQQANLACSVLGCGDCLWMLGQLDESRCESGAEWLLEKSSEDVGAVVMLPEDQVAVEEGGAHVQTRSSVDQDDLRARSRRCAEAAVVLRTPCTGAKGDQQQRSPTPPRRGGGI